jgi:hypothetical protein
MSRINYQAGPARARERLGTKLAADRFRREISKVLSNAFVRRLPASRHPHADDIAGEASADGACCQHSPERWEVMSSLLKSCHRIVATTMFGYP